MIGVATPLELWSGGVVTSDDRQGDEPPSPRTVVRDGQTWALGTAKTVAWIQRGTTYDRTISSAIPPIYDGYLTLVGQEWTSAEAEAGYDRKLVELLSTHEPTSWWLGYLDTDGRGTVVFPPRKKVKLYADWPYDLVLAGPEQALTWYESLPDLIFPADRSWLLSTLWDDSWTCIGGPSSLIDALAADAAFGARRVVPGQDATPPGHVSI